MGRHHVHATSTSSLTAVKVVAAVTASAALPAVLPAEAAADPVVVAPSPSVNWAPIIKCESGGNPHATNAESTASGLVQFLDGSWAAYGGLKYGRRAKDATPAEQLAIANNAYRRSGLTPWAASRHCWGSHLHQIESGPAPETPVPDLAEETRETPEAHPDPTPPVSPQPQQAVPPGIQLGARDADGRGWYRCSPADLRFDACDPDTIGQLEQYPTYLGHHADPLPPLGVTGEVRLQSFDTPMGPAPVTLSRKPSVEVAATPLGAGILATARTWAGVRYSWGGTSRSGVDCSGLVLRVLQARGLRPPRTADAQMHWTHRVSRNQLQPGDLVFRLNRSGHAYHVGIYTGNGRYIEAPNPGQRVSEHSLPGGRLAFGRVPAYH